MKRSELPSAFVASMHTLHEAGETEPALLDIARTVNANAQRQTGDRSP